MDYEKAWKELKEDLWEGANKDQWMGDWIDWDDVSNPAQVFLDRMSKVEDGEIIRSIK